MKSKLKSVWALETEIATLKDTIKELESKAQRITPHYGPQAGGGGNGQRLEVDVIRYVERQKYLQELVDKQTAAIMDVYKLICLLPPSPMRVVLVKRYINFKSFDDVAYIISLSTTKVAGNGSDNINAFHTTFEIMRRLVYIVHIINHHLS